MSNSANFFELVAEFQRNVDWLNTVLLGDKDTSVYIDGVQKPSISKEIQEKWLEINHEIDETIKALVDSQRSGVMAFLTYAEMVAYVPTEDERRSSFKVVNDGDVNQNGYYTWISNGNYRKDAEIISSEPKKFEESEAISSAALWRQAGNNLDKGFYPLIKDSEETIEDDEIRGFVVGADLTAINDAGDYDNRLYYSFAQYIKNKDEFEIYIYSSDTKGGGNWNGIVNFYKSDILHDAGWDSQSSKIIHLRKDYKGKPVYLSVIPANLKDKPDVRLNKGYSKAGILSTAFLEKGTFTEIYGLHDKIDEGMKKEKLPFHIDVLPAIPDNDYTKAIIHADFSEWGNHYYDVTLFYSFAITSIRDDGFSLDMYSATTENGANFNAVPDLYFNHHNLALNDTWDRQSIKLFHLRKEFTKPDGTKGNIYLSIIPAMFLARDTNNVAYNQAGFDTTVFLVGNSAMDYPSHFLFDENVVATEYLKANPHNFQPLQVRESSVLKTVRNAFIECMLTGKRQENREYCPAIIIKNVSGWENKLHIAFYKHDVTINNWDFTGNPGAIDISGDAIHSDDWMYFEKSGDDWGYKILIKPSEIPEGINVSGQSNIRFMPECWIPEFSTYISARPKPTVSVKPRFVLPEKVYAMVGKEMHLYYDAITLLPECGLGDPDMLYDVECSIGRQDKRSYTVTPTQAQIGEHSFTIKAYDNNQNIVESKTCKIVVVPAVNPNVEKAVLCIGDSTTDDTSQVVKTLQENVSELSGVTPIFKGTHGVAPYNHEARTGKHYAWYVRGGSVYKFHVTGLVDKPWQPNWLYKLDGTGSILVNLERQVDANGDGFVIGEIWTQPLESIGNGWSGTLTKANAWVDIPETITVTNTEILKSYSPFKDNQGIGVLDFSHYSTRFNIGNVDVLSIDLGINDSRGALKTNTVRLQIIADAKAIIDSFLSFNPFGRVMIGLPKSGCSTRPSNGGDRHDMFRINIHVLRELIIEHFDSGKYSERVHISPAGLMIDRYYAYPLIMKKPSIRYQEDMECHNDEVHPKAEGLDQMADMMLPALSYILNL